MRTEDTLGRIVLTTENGVERGEPLTAREAKACAAWLAECLRLGWPSDTLDELERLWWQYHETGRPEGSQTSEQ